MKTVRRHYTPERGWYDNHPLNLVIPADATTLAGFRKWSRSESGAFPATGRITYLGGELVIDLSPRLLVSHGHVNTAIFVTVAGLGEQQARGASLAGRVRPWLKKPGGGQYYMSGVRFVNVAAQLSHEPDGMYVSDAARRSGAIRPVPANDGRDAIKMEGTPDWVLEIVGPGSIELDTVRLREAYHAAGIPEYWLVDALADEFDFQLLRRGPTNYQCRRTRDGWQKSAVFGRHFRLVRYKDRLGQWDYTLEMK